MPVRLSSQAIDLRGHGNGREADLSVTGMRDYADDVASAVEQLSTKPIVTGWSMGRLVATQSRMRTPNEVFLMTLGDGQLTLQ